MGGLDSIQTVYKLSPQNLCGKMAIMMRNYYGDTILSEWG